MSVTTVIKSLDDSSDTVIPFELNLQDKTIEEKRLTLGLSLRKF